MIGRLIRAAVDIPARVVGLTIATTVAAATEVVDVLTEDENDSKS